MNTLLEKLGTQYGSWVVPDNMSLSSDSIVYSAGVGEDISFDLLLHSKYSCNIFLIDPTSRSKTHFDEIVSFYKTNDWNFSGDVQSDYESKIKNIKPDLHKFKYLNIGLWKCKDILKFYKQNNPTYVSQTVISGMFGQTFDEINVNSIKNVMQMYGHTKIDLLKLDIEGAELETIGQMLDDEIYPKYICVEFDLYLKGLDKTNETKKLIERLNQNGYKMLFNDQCNITFCK